MQRRFHKWVTLRQAFPTTLASDSPRSDIPREHRLIRSSVTLKYSGYRIYSSKRVFQMRRLFGGGAYLRAALFKNS